MKLLNKIKTYFRELLMLKAIIDESTSKNKRKKLIKNLLNQGN
jgi:hypothetical protein